MYISGLSHLKLLDPSQLALCPSQCNEHINHSPQYTINIYSKQAPFAMHLSLYQCKCPTVYNAHSTWQITLYQPPTVYNAHSTRQCLTVYIRSKPARQFADCHLAKRSQSYKQVVTNLQTPDLCIHMYKNCITYIQVDGVNGEEEILILVQRSLSCELHLICFDNWHLIAFHDGAQGWPSTP